MEKKVIGKEYASDTNWPIKPKVFPNWPLTEKVCCPCSSLLPEESLILWRLHRTADLAAAILLIDTEPQYLCEM